MTHPAVYIEVPTVGICVSDRVVIRCKHCMYLEGPFHNCPELVCHYDEDGYSEWSCWWLGQRVELVVRTDRLERPVVELVEGMDRKLTDAEVVEISTFARETIAARWDSPPETPRVP